MSVRAVVFDLDGTLAVPERDRQTLLDDATDATDAPSLARADYLEAHAAAVTGDTRVPVFDRLLDDGDPPPEAVARAYREAVNDALTPVEQAQPLVESLGNGMGYRVGVLTDGPEHAQLTKLTRLGWTDSFHATLVTGSMETRKPDPAVFLEICHRLDVEPSEAVYVGDNPETDVVGAADVGMSTVQVRYPGGPDAHSRADAMLDRDSLAQALPEVLDDL